MAKGFKIILGTTDSSNVVVSDTVSVRADVPHFTPPQVGFSFPPHISPKIGATLGPYWPVGEYWAFAYCKSTPTPSVDGTGRFLVQYYYNSGTWPNNPSRKFHQTFGDTATTINATLGPNTTDELLINSGGGDPIVGFASANDVSGLRHALIITNADLSSSTQGGTRAGFRNPGTDDLIAAYKYTSAQNKLFTIERLEHASGNPSWVAGSQIVEHPYHYVPLYENNGAVNHTVQPRILMIEEGVQFPLTGLVSVSGTQVSGLYTQFLAEVASGTQMAIRINGSGTWYLVSGVTSSSGLGIFDYGLNPQIVNGTAEAVPYAIGSGLITVQPGLVGCADWDIAISPDFHDGDSTPNPSSVSLTAGPIAIAVGGAPSGTLSYRWEVQRLGGPITTITNSGNAILVNFSGSMPGTTPGTPVDVRVYASGTGQTTCVHSDSLGYIGLKKSISAGTFYAEGNFFGTQLAPQIVDSWRRLGINTDPLFFKHRLYSYKPHEAKLNGDWVRANSYLSLQKGSIDLWPASGTFVVHFRHTNSLGSHSHLIYGTYTGKQTGQVDDRLTGVVTVGQLHILKDGTCAPRDISVYPVVPSNPLTPEFTFAYVPQIGTWPFTFVKSKPTSRYVYLENGLSFNQHNFNTSSGQPKWDLWFFKPGYPIHSTHQVPGQNYSGGTEVTADLPTWVDAGTIVAMAPWDSDKTGNQEVVIAANNWNRGNMGFMYIDSLTTNGTFVSQPVATTSSNRIYVADATSRPATATMAGYPRYTWIPPRGRLVVPNYDRTKTMIFSYTNWVEFNNGHNNGTQGIYFDNCWLLGINGSATSGNLMANQFICVYKEGKFDPSPTSVTAIGQTPEAQVIAPGIGVWILGFNSTIVDQIFASEVEGSAIGSYATPLTPPNWESFLVNFPTNGIIGPDPIYRAQIGATTTPPPAGGGGGGGGGTNISCLVGWTMVTIKHADGFEKEVPISEVRIGDQIKTMDRNTCLHGWATVTGAESHKVNEVFEVATPKKSIMVTGSHPIATFSEATKELWTKVYDLETGAWVITEDALEMVVAKIRLEGQYTVYDLTVPGPNAFVANGILVHNMKKL